jgi:hypothetical protein
VKGGAPPSTGDRASACTVGPADRGAPRADLRGSRTGRTAWTCVAAHKCYEVAATGQAHPRAHATMISSAHLRGLTATTAATDVTAFCHLSRKSHPWPIGQSHLILRTHPPGRSRHGIAWHTAPVASPLDYVFGLWKSYRFAIWTPLSPEQVAVQLERSLGNPWRDLRHLVVLHGSDPTGRFSFRPMASSNRRRLVVNGQIVNAPGGGSHVVGGLAHGTVEKAIGAWSLFS